MGEVQPSLAQGPPLLSLLWIAVTVCCRHFHFFPQMPGILLFSQKFFRVDLYSISQLLAVHLQLERRAVNEHHHCPVGFGKVGANSPPSQKQGNNKMVEAAQVWQSYLRAALSSFIKSSWLARQM